MLCQTITASTPAVLLTAAETWFLRAEASLRGINPKNESAKQCYETGVQTSFSQWGAGDCLGVDKGIALVIIGVTVLGIYSLRYS